MALFRRDDLEALVERREGPCVALYVPTHRAGPEVKQDRIRLKNLVRDAATQMEEMGFRSPVAARILAPAEALEDDTRFWDRDGAGLAIFLAPGFSRFYRLATPLAELAVVGDRFHLKPLLPVLSGDGRFFVLALSENRARLLEGTRHRVAEVDPAGVPHNLEEALWMDDPERQLQHHTGSSGPGRPTAVYHGQGMAADVEKTNRLRYFRRIDRPLTEFLEHERAPLVVASVEVNFPIYREANTYKHLLEEGIPGNPDELTPQELHDRAWKLVEPVFRRQQEEALARYREWAGTGKTTRQIEDVVAAAHHGRVEVLFVALDEHRWGTFEQDGAGSVTVHEQPEAGDVDLLDLAASRTIRNGGKVFAMAAEDVPARSPVAAVLRY